MRLVRPTVILVNEARGAVCDEVAIADAVRESRIGAFGSDVYSVEPFPESHPFFAIRDFSNVCLTPHSAWAAFEARERALKIVYDNIKAFQNGQKRNRIT